MRTLQIDKLKKPILLVDAIDEKVAYGIILQKYGTKAVLEWDFLGILTELKDEDARVLIPKNGNFQGKAMFKIFGTEKSYTTNILESFLSAIESEAYFENPEPKYISEWENDFGISGKILNRNWSEAEVKTFDKSRTLIFVKK